MNKFSLIGLVVLSFSSVACGGVQEEVQSPRSYASLSPQEKCERNPDACYEMSTEGDEIAARREAIRKEARETVEVREFRVSDFAGTRNGVYGE